MAAVSLDVAKAFDSVEWDKLLAVLEDFGLPNGLVAWMCSYFRDRRQCVKVEGSFSEWMPVKAGVVQGSILGPLLFNVFTARVSDDVPADVIVSAYADDLLLIGPMNSITEQVTIQGSIDTVTGNLLNKLGLRINATKSYFETFSFSTAPYTCQSDLTVMDLAINKNVKGMRYLGVIFDSKMSWSLNTASVVSKCKQVMGVFNRSIRKHLNPDQRKWFLSAKILSICLYGMCVTYPKGNPDRLRLERLNRTVCKNILNDYQLPYTEMLDRLQLSPVYRSVLHKRISLACSYNRNIRYLPENTLTTSTRYQGLRNLTHQNALRPVVSTSMYLEKSALHYLCDAWNQIPAFAANYNCSSLKRFLRDTAYDQGSNDMMYRIRVL